jgi:hypothetical protein
MPAIQRLLERWGFVKLGRYGLVRTPDGRILSTRPVVLDDGAGGRIVGWQDGDLAMAELAPWQPGERAAAPRLVSQSAPPVTPRSAPPVPAPVIPAPSMAAPAAPAAAPAASNVAQSPSTPATAAVMTAEVAADGPVDEDDWEWTIALARARAEEVEAAPAATPSSPARTRPMAAIAGAGIRGTSSSAERPGTEPIDAIDHDDDFRSATPPAIQVPAAPVAAAPVPRRAPVSQPVMQPPAVRPAPIARAAPATVIPVPTLPTLQGTSGASPLQPVLRTPATRTPASTTVHFAKGTGTVTPGMDARDAARAEAEVASTLAMSDDTDPNVSVGDRTTPGIAIPKAARTVALRPLPRGEGAERGGGPPKRSSPR